GDRRESITSQTRRANGRSTWTGKSWTGRSGTSVGSALNIWNACRRPWRTCFCGITRGRRLEGRKDERGSVQRHRESDEAPVPEGPPENRRLVGRLPSGDGVGGGRLSDRLQDGGRSRGFCPDHEKPRHEGDGGPGIRYVRLHHVLGLCRRNADV